jgi:hypothetical protein
MSLLQSLCSLAQWRKPYVKGVRATVTNSLDQLRDDRLVLHRVPQKTTIRWRTMGDVSAFLNTGQCDVSEIRP